MNHIIPEMKCKKSLSHETSILDFENQEEPNIEPRFDVGDVLITEQQNKIGITEGLPVVLVVDYKNQQYVCNFINIPFKEQDEFFVFDHMDKIPTISKMQ